MFYDPQMTFRNADADTFDMTRAAWLYGLRVIDDATVLYGKGFIMGDIIIRGKYVPTADEAAAELIVRHGLHKVLRWLGEDTETPALRKAREKHKIKVVKLKDGSYRVVPRDDA